MSIESWLAQIRANANREPWRPRVPFASMRQLEAYKALGYGERKYKPMSIINKIKALPDAVLESPTNLVTSAALEIADLKALAESHERLLAHCRDRVDSESYCYFDNGECMLHARCLTEDVAKAEKL